MFTLSKKSDYLTSCVIGVDLGVDLGNVYLVHLLHKCFCVILVYIYSQNKRE